jgi:hypothetical protein
METKMADPTPPLPKEPIAVTGIHLLRIGDNIIVNAEIDGKWVTVIEEYAEAPFSHIVEPAGMRARAAR